MNNNKAKYLHYKNKFNKLLRIYKLKRRILISGKKNLRMKNKIKLNPVQLIQEDPILPGTLLIKEKLRPCKLNLSKQ